MQFNQLGMDLLKKFEGCKLKPYKDLAGHLTIGYGHMDDSMDPALEISQEEADRLLQQDVDRTSGFVERLIGGTDLNDNQFSALVCFTYNVGWVNFKTSHLLALIKEGRNPQKEFQCWDHSNHIVIQGLLNRRIAESKLYMTPAT